MRKLTLCLLCLTLPTGNFQAAAETIYGLTNLQQLVTFDSSTRTVTSMVPLAGFSLTGEVLVSIDVRPNTGELFGVSNQNNLYVINPTTGARTQVGGTLSPASPGFTRGIDFNPTVDRIRLVSSNDVANNNLRVNPNDGVVIVDGQLAFAGVDPNAGDAPGVTGAGYTNSVAGATTTMLFNIESGNDVLVRQDPANAGTLITVGALGFDIVPSGGFTGFDISGATGTAYLVGNKLGTGGLTAGSLYQVNLTTGAASLLGAVSGLNSASFRDIAVANAPIPEPGTLCLMGIGVAAMVVRRLRRA